MAADPALAGRILRAFTAPDYARALTGPEDTVAVVRPLLLGREAEATVVVALDRRNRPIDATVLTVGSKDYTIMEPNGVFRWAMTRTRPVSAVVVTLRVADWTGEPVQRKSCPKSRAKKSRSIHIETS